MPFEKDVDKGGAETVSAPKTAGAVGKEEGAMDGESPGDTGSVAPVPARFDDAAAELDVGLAGCGVDATTFEYVLSLSVLVEVELRVNVVAEVLTV